MRRLGNDVLRRFGPLNRSTQTAATVITVLVPPDPGDIKSPKFRYSINNGRPNWMTGGLGRTVITSALYTTAGTAHTITLMRPFNYARIAEAVTANDTTVVLDKDPGVYSTNFNYPSPLSTGTAVTADNAIAGSDFVAFQLLDGTWHVTTVASVSSLTVTLTTGTPNITGGGAAINTPFYFFGITTNVSPVTGTAHSSTLTIASTNRINLADDDILGFMVSNFPGDPMILHSDNATAAGSFEGVSGHYARS